MGVEDEPQCPGERLESDLETCFLATNLDSPSPDISSQQQQSRVLADSVQSLMFRPASLIAGPEQSCFGSSSNGLMAEFPSLKQDQPMTVGPPVRCRRARPLSRSSGIASNRADFLDDLDVSARRCSMEHRSALRRRPLM